VVHRLVIDMERFVWPYVMIRKQVIQFSWQTSSVLHIRGCVLLPLHRIFKIFSSPDSTFHKLHTDIYFAEVLLLATHQLTRVRTIFETETLLNMLEVYSNLIWLTIELVKYTDRNLPQPTNDCWQTFNTWVFQAILSWLNWPITFNGLITPSTD